MTEAEFEKTLANYAQLAASAKPESEVARIVQLHEMQKQLIEAVRSNDDVTHDAPDMTIDEVSTEEWPTH